MFDAVVVDADLEILRIAGWALAENPVLACCVSHGALQVV
jgi:hypothetical protein